MFHFSICYIYIYMFHYLSSVQGYSQSPLLEWDEEAMETSVITPSDRQTPEQEQESPLCYNVFFLSYIACTCHGTESIVSHTVTLFFAQSVLSLFNFFEEL